jgi:mRNA-degrading endonuclease toxin of MazEF toxin-antitoxin module
MPGTDAGVANVHGITSIEHHRLERRAGRYETPVVEKVRSRIAWMLELSKNISA